MQRGKNKNEEERIKPRTLCNTIKQTNKHIIRVPEEDTKRQRAYLKKSNKKFPKSEGG